MPSSRRCAAARSRRSCGCARRSSATSPRSPKTRSNPAEADKLYRQGVALLDVNYPGSAALLNAKARLAGYLARTGQLATAEAMFREIVHSQPDASNLPPSFAHVLRPYVDLLLKKPGDPAATEEIFAATQLMVRPGLAQTQAVLARELSGGTDEASRLFRQSVTLTRQIERARIELARFDGLAKPTPGRSGARARAPRRRSPDPEGAARDPVGARQLPALPRRVERGHLACRSAKDAPGGRSLLPDDDRRRSPLRDADHPDERARGQARASPRPSSASKSTRCARPFRPSRTASA